MFSTSPPWVLLLAHPPSEPQTPADPMQVVSIVVEAAEMSEGEQGAPWPPEELPLLTW